MSDSAAVNTMDNEVVLGDFFELVHGLPDGGVDLAICDGPYGVTNKKWDRIGSVQEFNLRVIQTLAPKLKEGAALYLFGKPDCIDFIDYRQHLNLRAKIVWYQPSRLAQGRLNYTNNYDIICYFIKGERPATYNLDAIRVAQMVELEHRRRCENVPSVVNGKYGKTKFNEKGKNPGDVWGDIKQLTYKSRELVSRDALNTIQKPEKLIERIVLASSNPGDLVLDPFAGTGTVPVVCARHGRRFIAFESNANMVISSRRRMSRASASASIAGDMFDG